MHSTVTKLILLRLLVVSHFENNNFKLNKN